jgi:hypothetical protein
MRIPFTPDQFLELFRLYNLVVWPAQPLLYALAGGGTRAGRLTSAVLALLWLWSGLAYHLTLFTLIDPAAYLFGALFVLEGLLLIRVGVVGGRLAFAPPRDLDGAIGALLVGYALVGYPLVGALVGHRYPDAPTFGVPCPVTIYTLGLLAWTTRPVSRVVLAVPLLWALLGTIAALVLGMPEDLGLTVAAAFVVVRRYTKVDTLPVPRVAVHARRFGRAAR